MNHKPNYNNLDPQVAKFLTDLAKNNPPPIYTETPEKARQILDDLQAASVNTIPADIQDIVIPGGPTNEVSIRIVRPKGGQGILPVVLYMHGGGWILGNKNTHDRLIRELAHGANVAVVFVNYSLSPEAHYPVAIEQAYEVAKYIAKEGNKLMLDSNRMAIAGDSVGGLMATVLARLAKERGGPKFIYQALFYPTTDAGLNTESYKQFEDGFWLSKKSMEWFWDAYQPDKLKRSDPSVSPLQATVDQLKNMPPALIITDENDVLRDEGEAYARKLMHAGVEVIAIRILGTIHDFLMLDGLKNTAPTRGALSLACCQLRKVLSQHT